MERAEAEAIYDAGREAVVEVLLAMDRRIRQLEARVEKLERQLARLQHQATQRVAIGEVLIGAERHLRLAVGATHPRTLDSHTPSAERHLAVLMAVADRVALGVPLALRADDLAVK